MHYLDIAQTILWDRYKEKLEDHPKLTEMLNRINADILTVNGMLRSRQTVAVAIELYLMMNG